LEQRSDETYNAEYDDQVLDAIIEGSTIKYPPQMLENELKRAINFIQITFSVLVIILVLELYLLNIIDFSSFLFMFALGAVFSTVLSNGVFKVIEKSESNEINKLEKKEKLGMYFRSFTINILVFTIVTLLW
ncbi:MAG: hypothetical protein KGD68_11855, partial [Candidatus Lokiarchaeota archaeon]|nr:hypothetical protein [Candidatus Lokiarchaeota archaeon]